MFKPMNFEKQYKNNFSMLPNELDENEKYSELTPDHKYLYSKMLSRAFLSFRNKWIDKIGVYIIFERKEAMELLGCGESKVTDLFKKLVKVGLIKDVPQYNGKANKIYVGYPAKAKINKKKVKNTQEKRQSMFKHKQEALKKLNINFKIKSKMLAALIAQMHKYKLEMQKREVFSVRASDVTEIKEQIEYSYFYKHRSQLNLSQPLLDTVVLALSELKANPFRYKHIFPVDTVEEIASTINSSTLQSFFDHLKQNVNFDNVRNIKEYIKTTLLNFAFNFEVKLSEFECSLC